MPQTNNLTTNEIQLLNEFGLDLQTPDLIAKVEGILKEESELGKVFYTELIGLKKEQKLEMLEKMEYQNLDWQELTPKDNYYFFVPKDFSKSEEYDEFVSVKDIFEDFGSGVTTERDKINIHFTREQSQKVVDDFRNLSVEKIREKYAKSGADKDSRDWKVQNAKNDVCKNLDDENLIKKINYRPFDLRFIWYSGQSRGMVGTPSPKISQHFFQPNLGIVLTRQFKGAEFKHVFVSKDIQERHFISDQNYTFPLFRYEKIQGLVKEGSDKIHPAHFVHTPLVVPPTLASYTQEGNLERVSNFKSGIVEKFGFTDDLDLFYYIYAVLHLPNYRSKYHEQLKIDFPKIPTPEQLEKLELHQYPFLRGQAVKLGGLIQLGQNLVNLHLLGQNPLDATSTNYFKKIQIQTQNSTKFFGGNLSISKIKFDPNEQKLWINATSYFASVSQKVWEYRIGGYQVLDKFLKSRKENIELTLPEIKHLLEVINCLTATVELLG
jgi:predicted helicase